MAGGPIFPISAIPMTADRVYPLVYIGDGGVSPNEMTMGVEASLGGDATWGLRFMMPPTLPSGTGKLKLWALADKAGGEVAKVNPKWKSVAAEEDPSTGALNAEGTGTITWGAGDDDVYKELLVDLDADTLTANEMVVMDLVFETAAWTLDVESGWYACIIWE